MVRQVHTASGAALILLSVVSGGCRQVYRAETILHADGSLERAIYQGVNETPEAARRREAWTQIRYAPRPDELEKQGRSGTISQVPSSGRDGGPYFAAWGKFKSSQDIPDHYVMNAPSGSGVPDGKLRRDYQRRDYVFVVEHGWRETLTDVVQVGDMRRAREELADLLVDFGRDVFHEALGQEYDASDLFKWLRTQGKTWFVEVTDYTFVQAAAHKGSAAREAMAKGVADILARHGLVIMRDGKFLESKELDRVLEDFAVKHICRYVRRKKDGKPVDRATASAWLAEFKTEDTKDRQRTIGPFESAAKKVIAQKYGGEEAFSKRLDTLFVRIFGLHYSLFPLFSPEEFDYTLTMPGKVVETNGQILSDTCVRWQFDGSIAYPLGYTMECRSLESQTAAQDNLLKSRPLESRETMLEFASLVGDCKELADVIVRCRTEKDLAPLYRFRSRLASKGENESARKSLDRLFRLLKLPARPSH